MTEFFKYIGRFFKLLWKALSFIRSAVFNLLFIVVIVAIYIAYLDLTPPPQETKPEALVLDIQGHIVEQTTYVSPMDSVSNSLLDKSLPKETRLFDIVRAIRKAKQDDNIPGIVLKLDEMQATSLTKLRYIAKAINEFKSSGKPVYAIGDYYTQSQYYLASYADKILLSKNGAVLLHGYSAYGMYYKNLLDKLDINTHIFRVGTYKSAVEPFMRADMSKPAKTANQRWLNQLWQGYLDDVSTNRNIDVKQLKFSMTTFLNKLKSVHGDLAQLCLKMKLVDELVTRPEMRDQLASVFGSDGRDSFRGISYYDYLETLQQQPRSGHNQIAVVVASGTIMDGDQPRGVVGGDTTAALLRDALNDSDVKAVVLRVDSPGGSAFASEVIREEITALKEAGKPVIVSMSSLAASGGYWISMSADKIIAQPTTLTGSIGIFSVITTFENTLKNIGISTDGVGTTPFSGQGIVSGLSAQTQQAIQLTIEHGYQRFISLVAANRGMKPTDVDKIAQGRVWTGKDALKLGLVDQLGNFDDAIDEAATLAKLKHYQLNWMEKSLSPFQQFMMDLSHSAQTWFQWDLTKVLPDSLAPLSKQLAGDTALLNSLNDPRGQYAFCLNCQVE